MSSTTSNTVIYCCSRREEDDDYMGGSKCLDCSFQCCQQCVEYNGWITDNQRCLACYKKNYPEDFEEEYAGSPDYKDFCSIYKVPTKDE